MDKNSKVFEIALAWIFVTAINLGITIFVFSTISNRIPWHVTSLSAFGLYLLVVLIKFLLGPDELGVTTIFGKPHRIIKSGLNFGVWPFEKPVKLPKGRLEMNFPAGKITTQPGVFVYEYTDPEGKKVKKAIELEPEEIEVDAGAYASFSDEEEDLLQAVKFLPPNIRKAKDKGPALEKFFGQLVISTTRAKAADRTWMDDNNKRGELAEAVKKEVMKKGGTFDLAGLADNLEIVITSVKLPPKLQEALMKVEVERNEAIQAIIKAEAAKKAKIIAAEADQAEIILRADGDLHKKTNEAEALKINLTKQLEAFKVDASEFMKYLVSFQAALGYGEGDKTVPMLLGGATNLFDLATTIASTIKGVPPQDVKIEDIKNLLSTDAGKKLLAEEVAKVFKNNGEGEEVLGYLL